MRKLAGILILVFAFTMTTQAQKRYKKERLEKLTTEQRTTLAVKKMALALDLTEAQQRKVTPLIARQMIVREKMKEKRKALKESNKTLSADERFEDANTLLDRELVFQKKMKEILNDEQFAQFKKMKQKRKAMKKAQMKGAMKKKMMKRKANREYRN